MLDAIGLEYTLQETLDTVEDSVKWFKENEEPDLVFMDIQLADGISFEIFKNVNVEAPIIFTTAFDEYAIQAFKVNSIDYLLKPIKQEALKKALKKFEKASSRPNYDQEMFKKILGKLQTKRNRQGILVKEGGSFVQLKVADILYIYSEDSITFGVTEAKRYVIDETLDQVFASVDENRFFKINRGQIVARQAISKIEPYLNHRVKLKVKNPREIDFIVSRQKTSEFKLWINS